MSQEVARKRPYTEAQLKKCDCFRCGKPARFQWNACADDNVWRPLCEACDVELNVIVLRWMGFKNWKTKVKNYCKRITVKWSERFARDYFI